ncbi:MAG: hypothetical protein BUE48_000440 [Thermomonospora sp. CIF 1]|nr:MAG: hypothetical protein BUE48_000440 [Thermomonospora sp. CIF 1]
MAIGRSGRAEMTRMNIDIDEEALAELMELLETDDRDKAVNLAVQATAVRVRLAKPAQRELAELFASGALDLEALEQPWRQRHSSRTPAHSTDSTESLP